MQAEPEPGRVGAGAGQRGQFGGVNFVVRAQPMKGVGAPRTIFPTPVVTGGYVECHRGDSRVRVTIKLYRNPRIARGARGQT